VRWALVLVRLVAGWLLAKMLVAAVGWLLAGKRNSAEVAALDRHPGSVAWKHILLQPFSAAIGALPAPGQEQPVAVPETAEVLCRSLEARQGPSVPGKAR
jgi:hypothetical protein